MLVTAFVNCARSSTGARETGIGEAEAGARAARDPLRSARAHAARRARPRLGDLSAAADRAEASAGGLWHQFSYSITGNRTRVARICMPLLRLFRAREL